MSKMINLKINGQNISVKEGTTVLERQDKRESELHVMLPKRHK